MKIIDGRNLNALGFFPMDDYGSLFRKDLPLYGYTDTGVKFKAHRSTGEPHDTILRIFNESGRVDRAFTFDESRDIASALCDVLSDYSDTFYLCDNITFEDMLRGIRAV